PPSTEHVVGIQLTKRPTPAAARIDEDRRDRGDLEHNESMAQAWYAVCKAGAPRVAGGAPGKRRQKGSIVKWFAWFPCWPWHCCVSQCRPLPSPPLRPRPPRTAPPVERSRSRCPGAASPTHPAFSGTAGR